MITPENNDIAGALAAGRPLSYFLPSSASARVSAFILLPDQFNVSGSIALFIRQAVGIERSADLGAGFGGDPAD